MPRPALHPEIEAVIEDLTTSFDAISPARRARLGELTVHLRACRDRREPARLIFICTHNSRRSHLAQIWAQAAAAHFGVENVETYSGGTEATAFASPAVASLHRHGFRIEKDPGRDNPIVRVRFASDVPAMECFSKVYDQPPNPTADFAAVMVCSSADAGCPFVAGADARFAIPFEDPKSSDGTDHEADTYDERCREIGREMLFVLAGVADRDAVGEPEA